MSFFKELASNVGYFAKQRFSNNPGPNNQEIEIAQLNYSGVQDPNDRQAIYANWFFSARLGQPRGVDIRKLRDLAKSPWVQMVLTTFKKQIYTIPWEIVNADEEDETDRSKDIKKLTEFFNQINDDKQNVNDINSELITDLGEIDAGVLNYVYSNESYDIGEVPVYDAWGRIETYDIGLVLKPLGRRELVKLKTADGGTILKQVDIHKNLLNFWQYSFKHPRQNPTRFEKEEIEYLIMNKKSYDVYGFSPIQSIQQVLELLIQGTRYNKDLYKNNAIPDIIVSLPKLPGPDLRKLKRRWNRSYKGKPHQVGFVNWAIDKFHKLAGTNRDLEWLEGQKWYFKIAFGVFGVSPTEAGFFENSNKGNDEGQERVTVRNALKPYLQLLEKVHTNRTITEVLQQEDHGLKFKFFPKDHTAEKIEFEQDMKELELGVITINEYRKKKGKDKVEWGDEPLRRPFNPADGFANFGGEPGNPGQPPMPPGKPEDNPGKHPKDDKKKDKSLFKDLEVSEGEEMIEEAEDYSDFLLKTFDYFERKVLAAADKISISKDLNADSVIKSQKEMINKDFGEFMRNMFNAVNTKLFAAQVKKYLKADLLSGMVSAESETGMDIGFSQAYQDKLAKLQNEQLTGYTINGKLWPGIKGVTKDLQFKIIKTVQSSINENKSTKEIKEDIKNVFDGFSDWRANMIGRTETSRILAEGKLLGYKETGMKGEKIWSTAMDNRTSPICKRLNGQKQRLDDPFIDPETKKAFMTPPSHVNCRSTIYFVAD